MTAEHFFGSVPGRFLSFEAYRQAVADHPADKPGVFVEVGTREGQSAAFLGIEIAGAGKPIALHVVGDWDSEEEAKAFGKEVGAPLKKSGVVIRTWPNGDFGGKLAAAKFDDRSIDFLWIAVDWRMPNPAPMIADAIQAWLPKIKPGGKIGGDGWFVPGVRGVVSEAAGGPCSPMLETRRGRGESAYWIITCA